MSQRLLELLVSRGELDEERAATVHRLQRQSRHRSLPRILVDAGLDERSVQATVAELSGLDLVDLDPEDVDRQLFHELGDSWCRDHAVLPLITDGVRRVAVGRLDELFFVEQEMGGTGAEHVLALESAILAAIDVLKSEEDGQGHIEALLAGGPDRDHFIEDVIVEAESSPVVSFVDQVIETAARDGASDIHVEACRGGTRARFRIDGVLHDLAEAPDSLHTAIISRIKILSNLDIAERRLPQDGRIRMNVLGRPLDLRVSTVPASGGEKAVLRLLDDRSIRVGLEQLGFLEETLTLWRSAVASPHGIVLVTGPTGSGKTTTLYASLQEMDRQRLNISTVEDPVEYELQGITQIQAHDKIDMTFARALRSLLRQDPDVVLVGEIRDLETAGVAIQAAMTGHLVLSTLHTNDAPSSITRLINIGIEPFLVAGAVNGVLAQRLARRVCGKCAEVSAPTPEETAILGEVGIEASEIPHARGCSSCRGTGYSGRVGLYELLPLDDELRDVIASNPSVTAFRARCIDHGMVTLLRDGLAKVCAGLTTIEETLRIAA
jgi:type IV pilus assembly protein PilB